MLSKTPSYIEILISFCFFVKMFFQKVVMVTEKHQHGQQFGSENKKELKRVENAKQSNEGTRQFNNHTAHTHTIAFIFTWRARGCSWNTEQQSLSCGAATVTHLWQHRDEERGRRLCWWCHSSSKETRDETMETGLILLMEYCTHSPRVKTHTQTHNPKHRAVQPLLSGWGTDLHQLLQGKP